MLYKMTNKTLIARPIAKLVHIAETTNSAPTPTTVGKVTTAYNDIAIDIIIPIK